MKTLAVVLLGTTLAHAQNDKPAPLPDLGGLRLAPAQKAPETKSPAPLKPADFKGVAPVPSRTIAREIGSAHPTLSDPALGVRARPQMALGPMAATPMQKRVEVSVGMFHILTSYATIRVVAIGDPLIADVQVLSSKAALINGKKPGLTQVVVWDATGTARQFELVVTGYPSSLIDEIRQALAMPEIQVRVVRDSIVLEGEVKDADAKSRAGQIAALFAEKVMNLVTFKEAPVNAAAQMKLRETLAQVKAVLPAGVTAEMLGDKIVLRGMVETEDIRTRVETVVKQFVTDAVNLVELRPYTEAELKEAIGLPKVMVRILRDQVFLDGDVDSAEQSSNAAIIAGRSGKQVVNRLQPPKPPPTPVPPPQKTVLEEIQDAIREGNEKTKIKVRGTPLSIVLEGEAMDLAEADRAYRLAKSYAGMGAVDTSLLMLRNVQMVNLEMSIVEINRDRAKQQGVSIPPLGTGTVGQANPFVFGEGGVVGGPITRQTPLVINVTALATRGIARILSQPNLSVLSGRQAKFQVGGQIPVPSISTSGTGLQQQSVEYRPYGITVDIIPMLMPNGVVSIDLLTTVSSLDRANATVVGGSVVPAFFSREATSILEVPDGGSLGIGGLIDRRESQTLRKIPLIGDIPVIGKLFTSREFTRNESELIVFIKVKTTGQPLLRPYVQPSTTTVSRATSSVSTGGTSTGGN